MRATMVLGLPLVGSQLAIMLIGVTDTIMVGWLGAEDLAATVLGHQSIFVFWIFGMGFAQAMIPLIAIAEGRGDKREVRRATRMGLWVLILAGTLSMIPLWFSEDILLALGQNEAAAIKGGKYVRIAMWTMPPAMMMVGLRSFLTGLELAKIVLWATLAGAALNALLNYALIFGNWGAPRMEIEGAALASVGTNLLIMLVLLIYAVVNEKAREYDIFTRFWRPDWPAFFNILRIGWPISTGILAEVGIFMGASVFMGWISIVALAAHGIALQLASITFMIPLGLSNAASVRVGKAMGGNDPVGLGRAGFVALAISLVVGIAGGLIFYLIPEPLIRSFLDMDNQDALEVLAYAVPLLFIAALFQLVDGIQVVGMGVLRGLKDTRAPMLIAIFSYWVVGMPVAYTLGFKFDWGGVGIWSGLAIGLAIAAVMMTARFIMRERLGLVSNSQ